MQTQLDPKLVLARVAAEKTLAIKANLMSVASHPSRLLTHRGAATLMFTDGLVLDVDVVLATRDKVAYRQAGVLVKCPMSAIGAVEI